MTKLGWLFPGQASQYVGMGKDLYESTALGKSYFKLANDILGCDLKNIIFNGPEEILKRTEYTQPSIFLISSILSRLLQEKVGDPVVSAGHSLGEYSALLTADAFDLFRSLLYLEFARNDIEPFEAFSKLSILKITVFGSPTTSASINLEMYSTE